MIEKLKVLDKDYGGKSLSAAWFCGSMLIMISSPHNYFESAGLQAPATDMEQVERMKREVDAIIGLIDRLRLYKPEY